ncbi:serine/threonine protein kinase [bacterium]|nr:serine/threonine protein kinase [bacterium]
MRNRRIELNGWRQQFVLRCLCISLPFWLYGFPLAAYNSHIQGNLALTFVIAILLFWLMLSLACNRLLFSEKKVILPGIFHRNYAYDQIDKVRLNNSELILEIHTQKGARKLSFSIADLTAEAAAESWEIIATKLSAAEIDPKVRELLVHWSNYTLKAAGNNIAKIVQDKSDSKSHDFQMLIDLNAYRSWSHIARYLERYQKNVVKGWFIFWIGLPLSGFIYSLAERLGNISVFVGGCISLLMLLLFGIPLAICNAVSPMFIPLFANYPSATLSLSLLLLSAVKLYRAEREPDAADISSRGVRLLRHSSLGTYIRKQISWQDLDSVTVIRKSSNLIGKKVEFVRFQQKRQDKLRKIFLIDIPLRALAGPNMKEQLLEALHTWAPSIENDGLVFEALAPSEPDSYTELWLTSFSTAPKLEELTPLIPGAVLEHYQLKVESQLASGGQSVAYLASRPDQKKLVVLKETILPIYVEAARENVLAKFERDARLLKALDHPQIVKLHDYFVEGHRAFLMLDYVHGVTLLQRVREEGPLDEEIAIDLLKQMLGILAYLHNLPSPIVHRDFTPDNLLINEHNQITLIDFDVAMIDDQNKRNKATIVGKQSYLPPEQFRGKPTTQSDIYAMGASLYFALTGKEPTALQSSHPKLNSATVSDELDSLVANCTEPDTKDRFKSTSQILDALEKMQVKV